jgi:hypothetical protein
VNLEFLDIDLNTWSMIIFFAQALFYTFITLSMFAEGPSKTLYSFLILTFVFNQVIFVLYSIDTKQIGFLLTVVFQFFLILFVQMYLYNSIQNKLEGDYEDN